LHDFSVVVVKIKLCGDDIISVLLKKSTEIIWRIWLYWNYYWNRTRHTWFLLCKNHTLSVQF